MKRFNESEIARLEINGQTFDAVGDVVWGPTEYTFDLKEPITDINEDYILTITRKSAPDKPLVIKKLPANEVSLVLNNGGNVTETLRWAGLSEMPGSIYRAKFSK